MVLLLPVCMKTKLKVIKSMKRVWKAPDKIQSVFCCYKVENFDSNAWFYCLSIVSDGTIKLR